MAEADPYGARRQTLRDWQQRGGPPRLVRWRVEHPRLANLVIALVWIGALAAPAAFTAATLDGWIGLGVVFLLAAFGVVVAHRFLTGRDLVRTRDLLTAWDDLERGDTPAPEAGRWDRDQVLVSGWHLTSGPGRIHRWIADRPTRYVAVVSTVVLVPFVVAGIGIVVAGDDLSQRLQPLLWIPFGLLVVTAVRGHARTVSTAMGQWQREQDDGASGSSS